MPLAQHLIQALCLFIYFILLMEKTKHENHTVQREALTHFVHGLFSDIMIPHLHEFLSIGPHNQHNVKVRNFVFDPSVSHSYELSEALQGQAIIYVQSGVIQLQKKSGRLWVRQIEYKQGNFFTLINYKNLTGVEPQRYHLIPKAKSIISVIPIRQEFGYQWIRENSHKNQLLANIFFFNDTGIDIERKKKKFKDYTNLFQSQIFRRDTRILTEGKKNERIFIISRGEAKIYKHMHVRGQKGSSVAKNVEILYLNEGAVMGGELLLINSKAIQTIINNHAGDKKGVHQHQDQEEGEDHAENKEQNKRKRKQFRQHYGKVAIEQGGYDLFRANENKSNFSFVAQSANLEVYHIAIDDLISNISERNKINFLKFIEQTYVTILRRTHQKMMMHMDIERQKMGKVSQKLNVMAAKAYSSVESRSQGPSEKISIKKSQIESSGALDSYRAQTVLLNHQKHLQRKTDLIAREAKPKTNFVKKIEQILELKLNQAKKSEQAQMDLVKDLGQIFMKNNEGRSQDIEKRQAILQKKAAILTKMGGWQPGWDKIKKEGAPIPPKPSITSNNYLEGLNIQDYTQRLKQNCIAKIHQANKIKEQFMKVKAECVKCSCYENFDKFSQRKSMSSFSRTAYKTSEGWGRATHRMQTPAEEPPLETIYNSMRFLSERSKQKYNHNLHLLKVRRNKDKLQRRRSAPAI